jgi:sporadic carbohydrate cluster protein (TIGR04323 family)
MLHYSEWENITLDYNLEDYNWPKLVLQTIQEIHPHIKDLETIHNFLSGPDVFDLTIHVQNSFSRLQFMKMFDDFAEEYLKHKIGNKNYLIKRQATLNLVIPNQEKVKRRLPFHQGIFYNNGRGQRTIWMPLTRAEKTNSMYIANLEDSRTLTKKVLKDQMNLDEFEQECLKICHPVDLYPGQAHLFHQEHIHGNVNNQTGYTRMAIDWHVLIEGEEYGGRLPGGFFRAPGDYEQQEILDYNNKSFVAYVSNNSDFDKNIPLVFQRKVIEEYCGQKKIKHSGVLFENEYLKWLPILEHYIKQKPYGIVLCSIYSLPNDKQRCDYILNLALENNVELHFANEYCKLRNKEDFNKIKFYLNFAKRKKGVHSWEV